MGYYAGIDCQCNASVERECCCSNVDWTPTEVYRLRAQLVKAQKQLVTAKADGIREAIIDCGVDLDSSGGLSVDYLYLINYLEELTNTTIDKGE